MMYLKSVNGKVFYFQEGYVRDINFAKKKNHQSVTILGRFFNCVKIAHKVM